MSNKKVTAKDIAGMIDHSLLKPEMTVKDVVDGCFLAKEYGCATVCVRPCDVPIATETLKNSEVLVSTVVGFPHGSNLTNVKVMEAELAIDSGCKELDMVLNIGRLKSGDFEYVENDIKAVCETAHKKGVIVKVILENYYLTDEEKEKACRISERAGADFVKTSTGYAGGGATIHDLKLMRSVSSDKMRVKAAGGVRTLDAVLEVRAVGAQRCGASATKEIVEEAMNREESGTLALPDATGDGLSTGDEY